MRKLVFGMLLAAGAALPTMAAATMIQDRPPDAGQQHEHGDRPHDGGDRPQQQQRQAPAAVAQPRQQAAPAPQAQPQAQARPQAQPQGQARFDGRGDGARYRGGDQRRFDDGNRQPQQQQPQQQQQLQQQGYRGSNGGPNGLGQDRGPQPGYRGSQGGPNGYAPGQRPQDYGRGQAPQYRQNPGYQGGHPGGSNWNRGWRDDHRFDWGGYRAQNRYAFHLQRYYAPYGWHYGYRRFSPGFTLSAVLFDQGYWIGDPYAYRLPPAYYPYQWVRYYNDALLVDVRSGYVVDTVYDIFW